MNSAIVRLLTGRHPLPVFALLLTAFVHALVLGQLSVLLLAALLMAAGCQLVLQNYNALYARLVPLEIMGGHNRLRPAGRYTLLAYLLSGLPLLGLVSVWLAWFGLLLVFLFCAPDFFRLVRRLLFRRRLLKESLAELSQARAPLAAYVSGPANTAYQINQWIPVLERLSANSFIVIRERELFQSILNSTIPVVYARNMAHVEQVLGVGCRTVLYPGNPQKNAQALREYRLNHFFINHGESDKAVNQSKLLMAYDKLLVAGPMAERRLQEAGLPLRAGQVVHVGRPQAEIGLQVQQQPQSIRKVLYAPTWDGFADGVNYSSVSPFGFELVKQLVGSGRYQLIFKPHPYTGRRKEEQRRYLKLICDYCEKQGARVVDSLTPIYDVMNESDVLITDVSSVLNDYLITRKPIVLCVNARMVGMDIEQDFPSSRAAYQLRPGDDAAVLMQKIEQQDVIASRRETVRKDSLGHFEETALTRFEQVIMESLADEAE